MDPKRNAMDRGSTLVDFAAARAGGRPAAVRILIGSRRRIYRRAVEFFRVARFPPLFPEYTLGWAESARLCTCVKQRGMTARAQA